METDDLLEETTTMDPTVMKESLSEEEMIMDRTIEMIPMVKESLSEGKTMDLLDSMMKPLPEATKTEDHLIVKLVGAIITIMRQVIVDLKAIDVKNDTKY